MEFTKERNKRVDAANCEDVFLWNIIRRSGARWRSAMGSKILGGIFLVVIQILATSSNLGFVWG